jgi:hypothetical protein
MDNQNTTSSNSSRRMNTAHVLLGLFLGVVICGLLFFALLNSIDIHGSGNQSAALMFVLAAFVVGFLGLFLQFGRRMRGVVQGMLITFGIGALVFGVCIASI